MRKVVYLDQSVLSRFAKEPSSALLARLSELVVTNKALFPYSWTHHREAEFDDSLEEAILKVGACLSKGVHLRTRDEIIGEQARRVYRSFVGQGGDAFDWNDAYRQDPRGEISPKLMDTMLHARVSTHPFDRNQLWANRVLAAEDLSARRSRCSRTTYEDAKRCWADDNVRFYFHAPGAQSMRLHVQAEASQLGLKKSTVEELLAAHKSAYAFFDSEQCKLIPFIDIESSMLASLEFDEQSRPYSPSDFYDIETWAAYTPYVDMAVADRHMHQVLNRRGLAARYGCIVFPGTDHGIAKVIERIEEEATA